MQELIDETTNDPAFQALLERRLKEVEEHPARLLDGETVMAELRERLHRKREQCGLGRREDHSAQEP